MIETGLAVGTDLEEAEITGEVEDLLLVSRIIASMHVGDVVRIRCDGMPSVVWPFRAGRLELVMAGSGGITVEVDLERVRVAFSSDDRDRLRSVFEDDASTVPGSHAHVDVDTLGDVVAAGSVALVVAAADPPGSLHAQQEAVMRVLLDGEHGRHPDAVASLGELLADDPLRRYFGVDLLARAMLGDDRPGCHEAHADLLVRLVSGDVPSWGIETVMDELSTRREHEQLATRRSAIDRVLAAWTDPREQANQ